MQTWTIVNYFNCTRELSNVSKIHVNPNTVVVKCKLNTINGIEQDSHLDGLSETIARQKQMGQLISNELDMHVDLLDETEQVVDSTHARLNTAATRLGRVMEDHASNSQGIDFVGFQN